MSHNIKHDFVATHEYVKNPKTGRLISTKSVLFKKLLNQNILKLEEDTNPKVVFYWDDHTNAIKVLERLNIPEKKGKQHHYVARNNKVLKTLRQTTRDQHRDHTQESTIRVYRQNAHLFTPDMTDSAISQLLKQLVLKDMVKDPTPPVLDTSSKAKKYVLKEIISSEEENESDGSESDNDSDKESD